MSAFKYGNTTNTNATKNNISNELQVNISKKVFKETLTFIEEKWDKWSKDIENLNKDSTSLQRMFLQYNKDNRFLDLRQGVLKKIEEKKNMLLTLEKLVLNIKSQVNNTN